MQNAERYRAYCDVLAEAGIPYDPDLVYEGDYSIDCGTAGARVLLALPDRPTAIFAANDQTAIGVSEETQQLGLRIPDDLSLVGFDNIPEARFCQLTSVDHPLVQMGMMAVELLIKAIEGQKIENTITKIPTRLVVRESCKAPAERVKS
jgi:LacI family transcriptional regulator